MGDSGLWHCLEAVVAVGLCWRNPDCKRDECVGVAAGDWFIAELNTANPSKAKVAPSWRHRREVKGGGPDQIENYVLMCIWTDDKVANRLPESAGKEEKEELAED